MNEISDQGKNAKKDSPEIQKLSKRFCYFFYVIVKNSRWPRSGRSISFPGCLDMFFTI